MFEDGAVQPRTLSLFPEDRCDGLLPDNSIVHLKLPELRLCRPRQWGACWLVLTLWRELQLDRFWADRLAASCKGTRWDQVLLVLVAYRLIAPGSEWRLHREWFERSALSDLLGADFGLAEIHKLYACHDHLLKHKQALFDHLVARWRDLFNASFEVLLYDLTSTYFEADPPFPEGDKRRFGYSRDRRQDCVQVIIALVVTPEGLPLTYEVLPGNTADNTTLRGFLDRIERQYGKAQRIWLMDRGVPTAAVLAEMRQADPPVRYLVGTPKGRLSRLEQDLLAKPWQEVRPGVQVKLLPQDGEHQAGGFFVTPAKSNLDAHRVYSAAVDRTTGVICDQTITLDGYHTRRDYPERLRRVRFRDPETAKSLVFLTNHQTSLPALTICGLYKSRWQVELFFRWIKQHLRIKRFYGTSENAVKTQIWIAVSVYVLVAIVRRRLRLEVSLYTMLQVLSVTVFEKMPIQTAFLSGDDQIGNATDANQLSLFTFDRTAMGFHIERAALPSPQAPRPRALHPVRRAISHADPRPCGGCASLCAAQVPARTFRTSGRLGRRPRLDRGRNIIVLGKDGLELMCALLRARAPQVTHLRSHERLEADSASMVIIPQIPSLDWLEGALAAIRHALAANGRLIVCADRLSSTQTRIRRMLTLRGFSEIPVNRAADRLVISAEVPAFDLRRSA